MGGDMSRWSIVRAHGFRKKVQNALRKCKLENDGEELSNFGLFQELISRVLIGTNSRKRAKAVQASMAGRILTGHT